jgi:hypothetical protein
LKGIAHCDKRNPINAGCWIRAEEYPLGLEPVALHAQNRDSDQTKPIRFLWRTRQVRHGRPGFRASDHNILVEVEGLPYQATDLDVISGEDAFEETGL